MNHLTEVIHTVKRKPITISTAATHHHDKLVVVEDTSQQQQQQQQQQRILNHESPKVAVNNNNHEDHHPYRSGAFVWLAALIVVCLTLHAVHFLWTTKIDEIDISKNPHIGIKIVWTSSWITAAATGLGVIPFLFSSNVDNRLVAYGNSIAAGMMLSASIGLINEAFEAQIIIQSPFVAANDDDYDNNKQQQQQGLSIWNKQPLKPILLTIFGIIFGLLFIKESRKRLESSGEVSVGDLHGADAKKVILIMIVMTLHSMTEGIGIGASFHSHTLGMFISSTLAIHNIPEGLAIAMIMIPRKVPRLSTALWCVASSIPQPIMAVPAFLFVNYFKPIVPIGLGFAAGAMLYVVFFDLLAESQEILGSTKSMIITTISAVLMAIAQVNLR